MQAGRPGLRQRARAKKARRGKKVTVRKTPQGKPVLTCGKNRKKRCTAAGSAPDKVVAENNSLRGDKAREMVKQAAESLKNQVAALLGKIGSILDKMLS